MKNIRKCQRILNKYRKEIECFKEKKYIEDEPKIILKNLREYIQDGFNTLIYCEQYQLINEIEKNFCYRTTSPVFLWQEKLKGLYQVFATMLGIIDGKFDNYRIKIDFFTKFNNISEINKYREKINDIINARNKLLLDYNEINGIEKYDDLEKLIKEIIKFIPSHKKFDELSENMSKEYYNLSLQGNFMSSYLKGYNVAMYFSLEQILVIYNVLLNDFYNQLAKMTKDIKQIENNLGVDINENNFLRLKSNI